MLLEKESTLEKEKSIKYKGTARVKLEWLHFGDKQLDIKHVQDLQSRFQKDCRRLDIRNHVPAIIDEQHLDFALRISGISAGVLPIDAQHEFPELGFWPGYRLECLHGRHRIQAAKQALLAPDKWWTIDLYLADISSELRTALTEEYANEGQPSDGEAYRKIREYHFLKQSSLETRWWTRLSSHRATNLKQLLRHKDMTAAFDSFLEIPALLEGIRISTLHKMFATRCDEEILRYLRHIKDFWSYLLQQNKSAMERVDQVTVKALELTAPWASTVDAQILRGKVLGGVVFCTFDQREREEIWIRLQSFKGLVPSLYGFFEDIKLLEAWANCLKWVIRLGPRDTVSRALKEIYTGANQDTGSALVQETETIFMPVPANLAYQMDLGCRQLQAFAMRYHREIPKKPSGKNLLARPTAIVDTTKLREMADLANRLGFESSDITALKQYPNPTDLHASIENNRPILVTAGPGITREQRCGIPDIQSYEDDRKFLFISHLLDDRDEQSEGITSYFRLRSVYLNFYGMPSHVLRTNHASPQQHPTPMSGGVVYKASNIPPSAHSPTQSRAPEPMDVDVGEDERRQTEDIVMQEGEEEQRPSLQIQGVLTQAITLQEQQRRELLSDVSTAKLQTQEQEDYRQNFLRDLSALREQEQKQEQQRRKLLSDASTLEKQEQEHEKYRQKLARNASAFKEQEQEQEQRRQKLLSDVGTLERQEQECRKKLTWDAGTLKNQEREQEQQSQKLLCDVSTLEKQEQEQERQSQKLLCDVSTLEKQEQEQEQEQERRRQKLISDASTLKEQEQQQEQVYQKLTVEANALREQEQGREKQRQALATEEIKLANWNQRQEEQRRKLAEYANDLKDQETRQKEQRQKLIADESELNKAKKRQRKLRRDMLKQKREQKSVEQNGLEGKQDESAQEPEEQDIGELQRQGQDELADLESSPPLELEHRGVYANQDTNENSSAQVQDGTQEQVQEDGQKEEAQEDRLYEAEAQENGANEFIGQQEHRTEDDRQADGAQKAEQEDKAHKNTQTGGANEHRAPKRRVVAEESDDGAALRAQQVREGRKPLEKGKYQRLNRFGPHDMEWQSDTSMDGTKGDTARMPRKKPQTPRRQRRTQQKPKTATAAATTGNANSSTGFTSDFAYEAQHAPSWGT